MDTNICHPHPSPPPSRGREFRTFWRSLKNDNHAGEVARPPGLPELLKTALYVGFVAYGGPAILALMKKVIVEEKKWVSAEEFMNALSLAQMLPGAVGVTLFGYLGHRLKPPWGGLLAPAVFTLPAMTSITILAWAYFTFGNLGFVQAIFQGLGALVVALLIQATLTISSSVFHNMGRNALSGLVIVTFSFAALYLLRWNVVIIILISGLLAIFLLSRQAARVATITDHELIVPATGSKAKGAGAYLPLLVTFGLLAALFVFFEGTWMIFATFFKIGSLAFGGGYTAVPLIQHIVVDGMGWLDLRSFRDGIALGQITPGPVFITATFIGYKVQGIIGAFVSTIGIFAPSLLAMILLSRALEKLADLPMVKRFLKGMQVGFIGLLLYVVLQFGLQSLTGVKAWLVFALSLFYLTVWRKEVLWLILGTVAVSLLVFS